MIIPPRRLLKSVALQGPLPLLRLLVWLSDREDGVMGPPLDAFERWLLAAVRKASRG